MEDKIKTLENAMTVSKKYDDTEYTHFTEEAPEELKDLFLEHYEVRDINYNIFSEAIDTIVEAWEYLDADKKNADGLEEYIQENDNEFASIYTQSRLEYLNIWNQDEITEVLKDYGCTDIATACAYWYDQQVSEAIALIIREYLGKND